MNIPTYMRTWKYVRASLTYEYMYSTTNGQTDRQTDRLLSDRQTDNAYLSVTRTDGRIDRQIFADYLCFLLTFLTKECVNALFFYRFLSFFSSSFMSQMRQSVQIRSAELCIHTCQEPGIHTPRCFA